MADTGGSEPSGGMAASQYPGGLRGSGAGRTGGSFPKPRYDKAHGKEKRQLVQNEMRAEVVEERWSKMVGMKNLARSPGQSSE